MVDLVGTCPKGFWLEWIAEGDPAGTEESGVQWAWNTGHRFIQEIKPGDRFYIVAHGRLRGYAPVTRVHIQMGLGARGGQIIRKGGAVAVTIPDAIPGFQGLRRRWWHRDCEIPFPRWREAGHVPPHGRDLLIDEEDNPC
jgi:hypothetical protein